MLRRFIIRWLCSIIAIIGVFQTGHGNAQSTGNVVCWAQLGNTIRGPERGGYFGTIVDTAANGQTIIVSGGYDDSIVQVLKYNATSRKWGQVGSNIKGQRKAAISADGTTIIVTEQFDRLQYTSPAEIVVYKYIADDWVQVGRRIISNDYRAPDVKISADGTIIGIPSSDDSYIRVYKLNTGTPPFRWVQLGSDITAAKLWVGTSISLSKNGTTIAIAHPYSDAPQLPQGIVRLYKFNSSTSQWVQLGNTILAGAFGQDLIGQLGMNRDGTMIAFSVSRPNFSGLVRVYKFNPSTTRWIQLGSDIYSGLRSEDYFGGAVALSADGSTLVVGAPYTDGQVSDANFDSGRVFVFKFSSTTSSWQRHGHNINGLSSDDLFGYGVATSSDGKTIVVGSPGKDNYALSGEARVYKETPCDTGTGTGNSTGPSIPGRWNQVGNVINGTTGYEQFGSNVDISSDGRIIGAGFGRHPHESGTRILKFNVREREWEQIGSDLQGEPFFSMSADGTTVLTADYILGNYDKFYTIDATDFGVYKSVSNDWVQTGSTFNVNYTGSSAMSGDGKTIFIGFDDTGCGKIYKLSSSPYRWVPIDTVCNGVPIFSANGTIYAGHDYYRGAIQVFKLSGTPMKKVQLGSNVTNYTVRFPYKIVLSDDGTIIAIGTTVVRVYKLNAVSSRWIQVGADLVGTTSIALSGDGTTIAIGNSSYDGIGFAPSATNRDIGQVRVYKFVTNSWRQLGPSIDGTVVRGYFGRSVALTQDGTTMIVGATAVGENTYASGHVLVYKFTPTPTST